MGVQAETPPTWRMGLVLGSAQVQLNDGRSTAVLSGQGIANEQRIQGYKSSTKCLWPLSWPSSTEQSHTPRNQQTRHSVISHARFQYRRHLHIARGHVPPSSISRLRFCRRPSLLLHLHRQQQRCSVLLQRLRQRKLWQRL